MSTATETAAVAAPASVPHDTAVARELPQRKLHQNIAGLAADPKSGKKSSNTILLDLDQIWANQMENVRDAKEYSHEALEGLADSIETVGHLLQPLCVISVEPREDKDNKEYALAAGYRRYFALQLLAARDERWGKDVTCTLLETESDMEYALVQATENFCRKDLNAIERAISLQRILIAGGKNITRAEIAGDLGISAAQVTQYLDLLDLPAQVQQMVQRGDISFSAARLLKKVPGDDAKIAAATLATRTVYAKFEQYIESRYGENATVSTVNGDGAEGAGDGTGDGTGAAGAATADSTQSQKRSQVLRATELEGTYQPFLIEKVKTANSEVKLYTEKDLIAAQLDAINTVLRKPDTMLQKAIAPFIAEQERKEEAEKASKDAESKKKKFFTDCVRQVNALLNSDPDAEGNRPYPTLAAAMAPIMASTMALQQPAGAEKLKELGFQLNFATFTKDLHEAWKADKKAKDESKAKRQAEKEAAEKKAAEEAAAAAAKKAGGSAGDEAASTISSDEDGDPESAE